MTAVAVSESTAMRALRPLKAQPDARQVGSAEADQSRVDTRPAAGNDRAGNTRGEPSLKAEPDARQAGSAEADQSSIDTRPAADNDRAGITRGEPTPAADQEPTGRHRARGAHLNDVRQPPAGRGVGAERGTDRHPARVTGQSTPAARRSHETGRARPNEVGDVDTYATTGRADEHRSRRDEEHERDTGQAAARAEDTADDAADRPPPAQVSITHARAAVAVLVAHRAVQAQRRQAEAEHAERAARWHADHQLRTRSDAEWMCLQ